VILIGCFVHSSVNDVFEFDFNHRFYKLPIELSSARYTGIIIAVTLVSLLYALV
jgi:hypothetical protein